MAEPLELTREHFEILVVRELRKAGLESTESRIHRRSQLPEPERGYLLELHVLLSSGDWRRRALIACRRQEHPVGRADVESLKEHMTEAGVEVGLLFATADFTPDALLAADETGIALLRVADGRTVFDTGGWGTPGHYPAWLPAYLAQAVDRDPAGLVRYRILEGGQADSIIRRWRAVEGGEGR